MVSRFTTVDPGSFRKADSDAARPRGFSAEWVDARQQLKELTAASTPADDGDAPPAGPLTEWSGVFILTLRLTKEMPQISLRPI